jgi:hypothetical protein
MAESAIDELFSILYYYVTGLGVLHRHLFWFVHKGRTGRHPISFTS